jgi:hypothetical protein
MIRWARGCGSRCKVFDGEKKKFWNGSKWRKWEIVGGGVVVKAVIQSIHLISTGVSNLF